MRSRASAHTSEEAGQQVAQSLGQDEVTPALRCRLVGCGKGNLCAPQPRPSPKAQRARGYQPAQAVPRLKPQTSCTPPGTDEQVLTGTAARPGRPGCVPVGRVQR